MHRGILAAAAGALAALSAYATHAEIVDRVAAIVGSEAVTVSEIDIELGLEALLGSTERDTRPERRDEALRRLIDRRLVFEDLALTPFLLPQPEEVEREMLALAERPFLGGRDLAAALRHYGLTEADCRTFLAQRIGFERYVSFRFQTGLDADPKAVEAFYRDEYAALQRQAGRTPEPLEAVAGTIERILLERESNRLLEQRLKELRALHRIKILSAHLGETP